MSSGTIERTETGPRPTRAPVPALFPQDDPTPRSARPSGDWRAPQHRRPGQDPEDQARWAWRVLMGTALLAITVVYLANLAGWPRYFDDEGTYYSQAWAVQNLASLAPYTYWYDHPPVGWLQLAAFTWLPDLLVQGNSSLLSGRIVMVGYAVASALLVYMLGRRLGMARGWALAAMLVWALNPLSLYWGRQVLLDNVALPWLLGAFVLALNRRHHLGKHMLAGLFFGIAVLTKETVLIFAPALILAIWQSSFRPTRKFAVVGFTVLMALTGAMYLAYAAIRRELLPGPDHVSVWAALEFQLSSREGSGFILDPDGGPDGGAYGTLLSWLNLDPALLLAGLAAAAVLLFVRRFRPVALALALAVAVALRPDGYLPQMYVVAVLPLCALALLGLVDLVWGAIRRRSTRWVAVTGSGLVLALVAAAAVAQVDDHARVYRTAWTEQANRSQATTLAAAVSTLPRDANVVVDNTYWNDLVASGWDTDDVIWFYKVDSDAEVTDELGDYLGIDYLIWSDNMKDNAGPIVEEAFRNSEVVWENDVVDVFEHGDVTHRHALQLRRVLSEPEQAALAARELREVEERLQAEREALEVFMAQQSDRWPDLTNGQVEGIRLDRGVLSTSEMSDKYQTTSAVIVEVLEAHWLAEAGPEDPR